MIPNVVPRQPAAGRQRHLHADPERGVRPRLRAPRAARREHRLARGRDPGRRRRCTSWPPSSASRSRRRRRRTTRTSTAWASSEAEQAMGSTFSQLREGLAFVRSNRSVGWSLLYLGITASLVGVLGVLGPDFARQTLGLAAKDFAVVVLPLGFGIVTGILLLNQYGQYLPRRRVIEGGMIALGIMLAAAVRGGADQPPAPAGRRPGRARPLGRHVAADGRRGHRAGRRHLLRVRRDPIADPAPGGPARGRPRARVRDPQHAGVGRELPADHHRRPDLGPRSGTTVGPRRGRASSCSCRASRRSSCAGPLQPSEAHNAADPNTVDPIAAALGADRPDLARARGGGGRSADGEAEAARPTAKPHR